MLAQQAVADPDVSLIQNTPTTRTISRIELFLIDQTDCILQLTSKGVTGWGECELAVIGNAAGNPARSQAAGITSGITAGIKLDLVRWGNVYRELRGLPLPECPELIDRKRSSWGHERCALVRSALSHLAWQLQHEAYRVEADTEHSPLSRTSLLERSESYYSLY